MTTEDLKHEKFHLSSDFRDEKFKSFSLFLTLHVNFSTNLLVFLERVTKLRT